jgi:PAS domain S-box-containing protein
MNDIIRTLLARPRFDDDEKELMAGFLHITILTVFFMEILIGVTDAVRGIPTTGIILAMTIVPLGLAFWLNRRGKFSRLAAYIVSITMVFIQTGILSHGQGIHDIGLIVYAVILMISSFFLQRKGVFFISGAIIVAVAILVWGEILHFLPLKVQPSDLVTSPADFVIVSFIIIIGAVAISLMTEVMARAIVKARESEIRWRSLVENAPDVILLVSLEGEIQFANNNTLERSNESIIGRNVFEYIPEQSHETAELVFEQVKLGNKAVNEFQIYTFSGEQNWYSFRASPIRQPDGQINGIMVIATNIQHTKDYEAELQKSRKILQTRAEQLTTLYEIGKTVARLKNLDDLFNIVLQEMLIVIPLDVFMVVLYNDETREVSFPLLYDRGKMWNEPKRILPSDSWTAMVIETQSPITVNRTPEEMENEIRWLPIGDRTAPSASIMISPLLIGDKSIGAITAQSYALNVYDEEYLAILSGAANQIAIAIENSRLYEELQKELAERKHAEEEIRGLNAVLEERVHERTVELEDANNELSSFTYTVSHDLRTPLRGIHGLSHIFTEEFGANLSEEALEYIRRIRANARLMGELIDDLLTFMHLGRQPIHKVDIKMDELFQQVFNQMTEKESRNIKLIICPLPTAYADRSLLIQVITNLLSNAIKFTARRETAIIEIGSKRTGHEIIYYICDNGEGFNMAYSSKLFGVFQRLHHDDEFEGTGAGLAITQRIIRRHGGRVWAESSPGKGATFYFTLPTTGD